MVDIIQGKSRRWSHGGCRGYASPLAGHTCMRLGQVASEMKMIIRMLFDGVGHLFDCRNDCGDPKSLWIISLQPVVWLGASATLWFGCQRNSY